MVAVYVNPPPSPVSAAAPRRQPVRAPVGGRRHTSARVERHRMTDDNAPSGRTLYDVAVIGAGPAGAQAAVSAAHQMRHVLVLDAAPISQRKGRAYWSKSVHLQDAPVFPSITGPRFARALHHWMNAQEIRT